MMSSIGTNNAEDKAASANDPKPHYNDLIESCAADDVHPKRKEETNSIVPLVMTDEEIFAYEIADESKHKTEDV